MSEPGSTDLENADVVPGFVHENLEGAVWLSASDEELRAGLEKAFDYRGDITITKKDGSTIEGYLFDRRNGPTLADSYVRLIPKNEGGKVTVSYADISGLAFTGRDTAAGKSWQMWVKKYWEAKAAGESNIQLTPEKLD